MHLYFLSIRICSENDYIGNTSYNNLPTPSPPGVPCKVACQNSPPKSLNKISLQIRNSNYNMTDLRKSVLSNTNLKKLGVSLGPPSALQSGASSPLRNLEKIDSLRNMEKSDSVVNLTRLSLYGIYQDDSMLNLSRDDTEDEEAVVARVLKTSERPHSQGQSSLGYSGSILSPTTPTKRGIPLVLKLLILAASSFVYNQITKHINYNHFGANKLTNLPLTITNLFIFNLFEKLHLLSYFSSERLSASGNIAEYVVLVDNIIALTLQGLILSSLHPTLDKVLPKKFSARLMTSNPDPTKKAFFTDILRALVIFLGISYAIRKIEWSSFLQVAIVWSLLNPGMWSLLDGTISGFIASCLGSAVSCAFIYLQNGNAYSVLLEEDGYALWLWIGSFFFCGVTIFGKIGRAFA